MLTSDAAWDGDNTPELSKSFTSLMKESSLRIAASFFPAFIPFTASSVLLWAGGLESTRQKLVFQIEFLERTEGETRSKRFA